MAIWPTIPDPGEDLQSHLDPIRALKNIVEMLTGQRGGAPVSNARLYRGVIKPGALNSTVPVSQLRDGDLWIDMGNSAQLNYWDTHTKVWMHTS